MQQQDNHEYPFLYQRQTCHQVQPNQATYQKRQKCQPATYLQEVHTSRGSISTSTLPSIKLRKCSSKIITSILSFISGRLATKSNQIKQRSEERRVGKECR